MSIHKQDIQIKRPPFLGGGEWSLQRLNSINVLLGRNGCGKSLLLRAMRDLLPENSHYIVPERTGDIVFEAGLIANVSSSSGRKQQSQGNFAANYRQGVVTRIQTYYTTRGTKRIEDIEHNPEDLMKPLAIILPDFKISVNSEAPFYNLMRVKDGTSVTSVSTLSSGESQLLTLGMDVLTIVGIWELEKMQDRILLIDEPDAHIHPDLQIKFADFINTVSIEYNIQIIVATHSTTLLSALGQFGKDKVSLLYMKTDQEQIKGEVYDSISKEIASFLGGHLLMGHLFAAPVLLVEGDDDYRIWVQVARCGKVDICVLPCDGEEIKKYQKTLENMFTVLSEDTSLRGLALLDGDKGLPQDQPGSPQKYVPFVQLNCHESENLYLTDEVLSELGYSWDEAVTKIVEKAEKYGTKDEELKGIGAIDRQRGDIKNIINEISRILDPKDLLWTVRLGKILGKEKPIGMLEEFIGTDVVSRIWSSATAQAVSENSE